MKATDIPRAKDGSEAIDGDYDPLADKLYERNANMNDKRLVALGRLAGIEGEAGIKNKLSVRLGMNRSQFTRLAAGGDFSVRTIKRIAEHLDVDPVEVFRAVAQ